MRILTATSVVLILATESIISTIGGTRSLTKNERMVPYEIQVGILTGAPSVGNLHLSILVKDPETRATIMVMAAGPEVATNVGPIRAINASLSSQLYDLDIPLDMGRSGL